MRKKRDKKYLLTSVTCLMLGIFMLISLTSKDTYSYVIDNNENVIECVGVASPDKKRCCDSVSSFSNRISYDSQKDAKDACLEYALNKLYNYYECHVDGSNQWILMTYNGCKY